jgi:hypothetical protein
MLTGWIEFPFSGIGAYQKCSASAGRVHNLLFAILDTKTVNQVYNLNFSIELAKLATLFWGDEALKYVAYDFVIKLREIELMYLLNKFPPVCNGAIRVSSCIGRDSLFTFMVTFYMI